MTNDSFPLHCDTAGLYELLLNTYYLLLAPRYSLLTPRYSLLATRYLPPNTYYLLLTTGRRDRVLQTGAESNSEEREGDLMAFRLQ